MTPTGDSQPRWEPAPGLWVQGGETSTGNQGDFCRSFRSNWEKKTSFQRAAADQDINKGSCILP